MTTQLAPLSPEQQRIGELRDSLNRAIVQLGICLARMKGCEENHPDTHRVSLLEVPGWIIDHKAVLSSATDGHQIREVDIGTWRHSSR